MEPNEWIEIFDYAVWGNWSEVFAAIGTVGTLLTAVYLLQRERLSTRRQQAEQVVAWVDRRSDTDNYDIQIFNGSDFPVYQVFLYRQDGNDAETLMQMTRVGHPTGRRITFFGAGHEATAEDTEGNRRPDTHWYLYFRDRNGRQWKRDLVPCTVVELNRGPWGNKDPLAPPSESP